MNNVHSQVPPIDYQNLPIDVSNMLLLQAADSMSGRTPRETSNAEESSKIVDPEPTDVVDRVLNEESERITSSKKRNNKPRLDIS